MIRVLSWAILGLVATTAALLVILSAAFMQTIEEESVYEPTGD